MSFMPETLIVSEALRIILEHTGTGSIEEKNLSDAMNHILAMEIKSDRDLPPFNRSAVDGYAIRSEDFKTGIKEFKIKGTVLAGSHERFELNRGDCVHIMTGAAVPDGLDAVIMVEVSEKNGETVRFNKSTVDPWSNISRRGEDAGKGDILVKAGAPADPSMIHIAAACGADHLKVFQKPSVSLVTTGDELVSIHETPLPNQIRDSSSHSVEILLKNYEMGFKTRKRVKDSEEEIYEAVKEGIQSDLLIVTGGVSMGVTDFVPVIFEKLGVKKIFHKVKIKPGYPFWFGKSEQGCLVFGLPGNPVSTQIGFKTFVEPCIRKFSGMPLQKSVFLPLLTEKNKKHDREEYAQAKIVNRENQSFLEPIKHHGSGDFVNLLGSDGVMIHPAEQKTIRKGEFAEFLFWKPV